MNDMHELWLERLQNDLSRRFRGKNLDHIVFLGVGNRMRGDDGVGPVLIDMLKGCIPGTIDAGSVPENFTSAVKRLDPEAIVLIDAVKFDGYPPGYASMLEIEDVEKRRISVHNFSLDVVMGYLKEETGADVFMIGVQPEVIADCEGLTPELTSSLHLLAGMIIDLFLKK
jgi:hydrogenase 3 maturation protease